MFDAAVIQLPVGQASDGVEALHKAEELQPDLILLDIGLPTLNGIETARRLQISAPRVRILFLSQESSSDVVHEALDSGGLGYILKTRAGADLLPAIKAVLAGTVFVSDGLEIHRATKATTERFFHRHEVMFYSDDAGFVDGLGDFIAATLKSRKTAIVVATKSHQEGLVQRLKADSWDIDGAIQEGTYIALHSVDVLGTIMVNGSPDRTRLFESVGGLIDSLTKTTKREHRGVSACGECAPLLLAKGETDAAIRVEQLWDELTKIHAVDLLCAYPMSSFRGGQENPTFKSICAEHSAIHFR